MKQGEADKERLFDSAVRFLSAAAFNSCNEERRFEQLDFGKMLRNSLHEDALQTTISNF